MISKIKNTIGKRVSYKLFFILFIFIFISSCFLTACFYQIEKKSLTQTLITNGTLLSDIFASNARLGVFSESSHLLDNSIEGIVEQENVLSVYILKTNGQVLKNWTKEKSTSLTVLSHMEVPAQLAIHQEPLFVDSENTFHFWAPVTSGSRNSNDGLIMFGKESAKKSVTTIGYVSIVIDKKKLKNRLKNLFIKITLACILFLTLGSVFFLVLINKMISPLNRLTRGVKNFGEKGIFGTVPVETEDEIGKLAKAFNNMSAVLKIKEDALRESEEKYRLIVENTADVIIITDMEGHVTYISPACIKVWGFGPEYFLNKHFWDIIYENDEKARTFHDRALKGDTGPISDWPTLTKEGDIKFISQTFSCITNKNEIQYVIYVLRDITEEKKLRKESELRLQQIIQADKLASLGEVVAGVAHEINNPNSFIAYNIPILEETWEIFKPIIEAYASEWGDYEVGRKISLNELCQDMAEIIESLKMSSKRINHVVNNLKDFAKLDECNNLKAVKINDVIKRALTIVGSQLKKSASTIEINYCQDLPVIQGHFQKLEQIVINLLVNASNAIKIKEKGKIRVSTKFLTTLNAVIIEVEDNGAGIPSENIDRLFDPFFTTRRNEGGTGLGLSVSYGLVQEHNGLIGVLSKPGKGSRFSVYLPLDIKSNLDIRPAILCIDDNEQLLEMLKTYLEKSKNLVVYTLNSLRNVFSQLNYHPEIDTVIFPANFEDSLLDGWQLLKKISVKYPLINVIMHMNRKEEGRHIDNEYQPDHTLYTPLEMNHLFELIKKIGRQRL